MEGGRVVGGGAHCGGEQVAVGLVDHHEICELHDPALDALELVAPTGRHQHHEEVDHRGDVDLRLPDADRLHQHDVEARGLAQQHRLTRATGHAAERAGRGRRAHECAG